ncbi:hypothetical protein [Streptomyces sp. CAU 1734]|uniref:hypothetical protein n=1 Tax=Streptomyces sp. CAU 1734 TaxID=3140360 RepID=UPI0032613378
MTAPVVFDVSYVPDPPVVTVRATGLTDTALTVEVTGLDLRKVTFKPKTALAAVLSDLVNSLAEAAPAIVRQKTADLSPDIPLGEPIGCSIPAGGSAVRIRLASPELSAHGDMLMISGTADVS